MKQDNDICGYCRLEPIEVDGLCQECLAEHQEAWSKIDDYLMGNT